MRKIILLFVLMSCGAYSQGENKLDRSSLDKIKKVEVSSDLMRGYLIRAVNRISVSTTDTTLVNDCKVYAKELETMPIVVKTTETKPGKNIKLSDIPSEKLKKFKTEEDKFNSTIFLTHKKQSDILYTYIGIRSGSPYLRLVCKYTGKDWVFAKKIVFLIDGVRYDYKPLQVKREAFLGGVYEKVDDLVFDSTMNLMKAISEAKETIDIRFEGDDHTRDFKANIKMVPSFKETLELYNQL